MPYRQIPLVFDEIYHVFNRGVARLPIYSHKSNFSRFLELIDYYRFDKTPTSFSNLKKLPVDERSRILQYIRNENQPHVEILTFCLMDNHYHFILKQKTQNGIVKFISNLQNSYAKYFNTKSERSGPLFQPMFKAVRIVTDEQLLHVSRYIHLNPSTGYLVKINDLENYPWSSLQDYLGNIEHHFVDITLINGLIGNKKKYREFIYNQAEYQRKLADIKHLILE